MGNRQSAEEDTREYREGYPGQPDDLTANKNVEFYSGRITTDPGGDSIDAFHTSVDAGGHRGDYDWLENDHSYIQWLFPIREPGLNPRAQVLQKHEADIIAADANLKGNFVKSYETMLDFYGMKLADSTTGTVARKDDDTFIRGYSNLHKSFHNYLRITRILKCLGEVGLEHYKKPFVLHVLKEIHVHGHLSNCRESCIDYWAPTIKDDNERAELLVTGRQLHADMDCDMETYRGIAAYGGWRF